MSSRYLVLLSKADLHGIITIKILSECAYSFNSETWCHFLLLRSNNCVHYSIEVKNEPIGLNKQGLSRFTDIEHGNRGTIMRDQSEKNRFVCVTSLTRFQKFHFFSAKPHSDLKFQFSNYSEELSINLTIFTVS
ncbi:hypothetical protein RF11_06057 [Thelohanellus kitauei]|uniref:Uncharacterized protein n=1 Tax=Thelohanellus kitauei TaxID=669202 RepID=A0A0C2MNU4_THEKT|nr:hypothetical protein RF11_06057 [Thelohanellus kitauei]